MATSNHYIDDLRRMIQRTEPPSAPYLTRTRFERQLFGSVTAYANKVYNSAPKGLSRQHATEFLERVRPNTSGRVPIEMASDIYERFTYLCDNSHWSNDGHD